MKPLTPAVHENVVVGIRVRPFQKHETRELAVRMAGNTCQISSEERGIQKFTVDKCFWSNDVEDPAIPFASQETLFDALGAPLVARLLEGFNCSLVAYGPTGSGKTYSLFGDVGTAAPSDVGLIPRIVNHLFEKGANQISSATCTAVEVYLDQVYDLLQDGRVEVHLRSDPVKKTYYLVGATSAPVESFSNMHRLLQEAERRKTVAATLRNANSSRAHTIVELSVELHSPERRVVHLAFADLAGSERIQETHSEGITLEQAKHINLSLLSLGKCVEAAARLGPEGNPNDIPHFRDTTLTRMLKDHIGGNTLLTLLVTIAPGSRDYSQSIHALRFGDRAKHITSHATIVTALPEAIVPTNTLLDAAINVQSDAADFGRGGRVYLFRHTKEYLVAQLTIRLHGVLRREERLRVNISLEEQQSYASLVRYCNREIARAHAHAVKMELFRLPVLVRMQRAMAVHHRNHALDDGKEASPPLSHRSHDGQVAALPHLRKAPNPPPAGASSSAGIGGVGAEFNGNTEPPTVAGPAEEPAAPRVLAPQPPKVPFQPNARNARASKKLKQQLAALPSTSSDPALKPSTAATAKEEPNATPRSSSSESSRAKKNAIRRAVAANGQAAVNPVVPASPRTAKPATESKITETSRGAAGPVVESDKRPSLPAPEGDVAKKARAKKGGASSAATAAGAAREPAPKRNPAAAPSPTKVEAHPVDIPSSRKSSLESPRQVSGRSTPQTTSKSSHRNAAARKVAKAALVKPLLAEEYMKRVMIDGEQAVMWKRFIKDVGEAVPQHGVEAAREAEVKKHHSKEALLRRRSSAVSPAVLRSTSSVTPDSAQEVTTAVTLSSGDDVQPLLKGESSSGTLPQSNSAAPTGPDHADRDFSSPSFQQVTASFQQSISPPVEAELRVSTEPPVATAMIGGGDDDDDDRAQWTLGRGSSNVNRVQSARRVRTGSMFGGSQQTNSLGTQNNKNAAAQDASLVREAKGPPALQSPAPPPPLTRFSPAGVSSDGLEVIVVEDGKSAAAAEALESRERLTIQGDEVREMQIILAKCSVHAALLVDSVSAAHVQRHAAAKGMIHAMVLGWMGVGGSSYVSDLKDATDSHGKRMSTVLNEDDNSEFRLDSVSWVWLLQYLEYAGRLALACKEESVLHELRSRFTGKPEHGASLLSLIRDDLSVLEFEMTRGVYLLSHSSGGGEDGAPFDSPSSTSELELSLEPETVRDSGILLQPILVKNRSHFSHRYSLTGDGVQRRRVRTVSFDEGVPVAPRRSSVVQKENALGLLQLPCRNNDTDHPSSGPALPQLRTDTTVETERMISPVESTPSSPRSPTRSSSRSPSTPTRSPSSSRSTSGSPSPVETNHGTLRTFDHVEYATPRTGVTATMEYRLVRHVRELEAISSEITVQNSRGTFTEAEQQRVADKESESDRVKQNMVDRVTDPRTKVILRSETSDRDEDGNDTQVFQDFFADLVFSTDIKPVNLSLVRALVDAVRQNRCDPSVDLVSLVETRGLVATACTDGSVGYLRTLLNLYRTFLQCGGEDGESGTGPSSAPPDVNLDFNEIMCCAMFNQLHRIPLVHAILQYVVVRADLYPTLHHAFVEQVATMAHEWNEFLSDICSVKKAIPKENRTNRNELVRLLLTTPREVIPIDPLDEGADDNTRLSRVAKDGDAALLALYLTNLSAEDRTQLLLHVSASKTTALIQAVLGGSVACVDAICDALCELATSDPDGVAVVLGVRLEEGGTAQELAQQLMRGAAVEAAIERVTSAVHGVRR